MISVSTKTTTTALPSYRPAKSSKVVMKAAPLPMKANKAESKRAKSEKKAQTKMTDFDFVGIAG